MNTSPRRSPIAGFFLVSLPLLAAPAISRAQPADEALRQRFLDEAPAKWEELLQRIEFIQGSMSSTSVVDGLVADRSSFEFRINQSSRLMIQQSLLETAPRGTAHVVNPKYSFTLTRKSADAPWLITHFHEGPPATGPDNVGAKIADLLPLSTRVMVALRTDSLPDMVRNKHLRIRNVAESPADARLVQVEFDYVDVQQPGETPRFNLVQGGRIVLDPDRFWCVRSSELNLKSRSGAGRFTWTVELVDPSAPVPIPKQLRNKEEWTLNDGKSMIIETAVDYELAIPKRPPPDADFSLTAFGLKEPPGVVWERPTPNYVWILIAAGVCGVLAVGFRWLARRRPAAAG